MSDVAVGLVLRVLKVVMLAVVFGPDHPACERTVVTRLANEIEKYLKAIR